MKDYNFEKYEKEIHEASMRDFGRISTICSILMILGGGCYLFSMYSLVELNEILKIDANFIKLFYADNLNEQEYTKAYINFSIIFFMIISVISIILYGGLFLFFKKIFSYFKGNKYSYSFYKEQINEMLTAIIFLLGFIPGILKFIFSSKETTIIEELDSVYIIFLMSLMAPYIYSLFLKIYDMNMQRNFQKSFEKHLEFKFKK